MKIKVIGRFEILSSGEELLMVRIDNGRKRDILISDFIFPLFIAKMEGLRSDVKNSLLLNMTLDQMSRESREALISFYIATWSRDNNIAGNITDLVGPKVLNFLGRGLEPTREGEYRKPVLDIPIFVEVAKPYRVIKKGKNTIYKNVKYGVEVVVNKCCRKPIGHFLFPKSSFWMYEVPANMTYERIEN